MKWIVVLYFVLNILSTYLLTSPILNPSIVTFTPSLLNMVSSVLGSAAILLLILAFGMCLIKKKRSISKYLICVTFLLNIFLLLLGYFTKNYKTMLSFYNLTLFRNPNAGFAYQIFLDGLNEVIFSVQVLCLLPTVLIFVVYLIKRKNILGKVNIKIRFNVLLLLISLLVSLSNLTLFKHKLDNNWMFRTEVSQYGIEICGVYNYYFGELFVGINYSDDYYKKIENKSSYISNYNKNLETNINVLDNLKYDNKNIGILEDMNLFVIQAEALQNFCISYSYEDKLLMPYMNKLLQDENMFYFSNMHTIVGLGNTSDAEFAFNTGYYPLGDLTINWEAYDEMFEIQSLPKMFGDEYVSYSYNPTIEGFYAHKYVHENLYEFDRFTGFETFNKKYPYDRNKELYLHKKWASDEAILEYALKASQEIINDDKKSFTFLQTIAPHYPFVDISDKYPSPQKMTNFKGASKKFNNYLNQISYNDKVLYDFLLNSGEKLKDTVFIIYGDHGNSLSKRDYEKLFSTTFSEIEYQKMLQEIPAFIYDPSGKISEYLNSSGIDLGYMLNRTLSQIDLFQTVKSMFNLECDVSLGVNIFSEEPSFAVNPKTLDIIADEFYYMVKNDNYYLGDITYLEMMDILDRIKKFKMANDVELTKRMKMGREFN